MVPTVSRAIGLPNLIQNYWWLRSPYTGYGNHVWQVIPSGGVTVDYDYDYNVNLSYGRRIAVLVWLRLCMFRDFVR